MHKHCYFVAGDADEASEMEHASDADTDVIRSFAYLFSFLLISLCLSPNHLWLILLMRLVLNLATLFIGLPCSSSCSALLLYTVCSVPIALYITAQVRSPCVRRQSEHRPGCNLVVLCTIVGSYLPY